MAVFASALLLSGAAYAQRGRSQPAANSSAYDLSNEQPVQGTVVQYIEKSDRAPLGAHVIVQTASGQVDVHIGDPRLLKQNNFTLTAGNTIRVIGVTSSSGQSNVFLARLIQTGTNIIAVRSTTGIPYVVAELRGGRISPEAAKRQAGAR